MAWLDDRFRKRIKFRINNTGGVQSECPALFMADTEYLVAVEEMHIDGRDIRFTASDEVTLLPFCILSGINTPNTEFGVRVDTIPVGESFVYMYFDYVCNSITPLSTADFFYTSATTENTPGVTIGDRSIDVALYMWVYGQGMGDITERWSPTFNALNVSGFQFDMYCENTAHPLGSCTHWINITGGAEWFYYHWRSSCYAVPPPCNDDPWSESCFSDATGLTGVHELNLIVQMWYTQSGMQSRLVTTLAVYLQNHGSINVSDQGLEVCPNPVNTETFYLKIGGNDGLDGKSYPNAWGTLGHAFAHMPADQGNILRVDVGSYSFAYGAAPSRCTNFIGGYWDGTWNDWYPGCGHDRPTISALNGGQFSNADVSFTYFLINQLNAPLCFPMSGQFYTFRFVDCVYTGMLFAGDSVITLVNTDGTFHENADSLVVTVTPDYYLFVFDEWNGFTTFTPRDIATITNDDITMLIDTWSLTGDQNKVWAVNATGNRTITFRLGDMLINMKYDLLVDTVKVSDATSDGTGRVTFPPYIGGFSEKTFTTEVTVEEEDPFFRGASVHAFPVSTDPAHVSPVSTDPMHEASIKTVPTHDITLKSNPTHK